MEDFSGHDYFAATDIVATDKMTRARPGHCLCSDFMLWQTIPCRLCRLYLGTLEPGINGP